MRSITKATQSVQYSTIQYLTMPYYAIQYCAVQYQPTQLQYNNAMQYIQYSTVQKITMHKCNTVLQIIKLRVCISCSLFSVFPDCQCLGYSIMERRRYRVTRFDSHQLSNQLFTICSIKYKSLVSVHQSLLSLSIV